MMKENFKLNTARRGPIKDPVHPTDFNQLKIMFGCECCSFFDPEHSSCALEMPTKAHTTSTQIKDYNVSGKMAICRFLEID